MEGSVHEIALFVLGIPTFLALLLVGIGTVAKAWDYCRSWVRRARIRNRALGWGSARHPNQDLTEEPEPPQLEAAQQALSLLRGPQPPHVDNAKGADDAPTSAA